MRIFSSENRAFGDCSPAGAGLPADHAAADRGRAAQSDRLHKSPPRKMVARSWSPLLGHLVDQYSRLVTMPGWGTGYFPSEPSRNGARLSNASLSTSGASSWSQWSISS